MATKRTGRPTEQEGHVQASLNARITLEQAEYLQEIADELGSTLSAAVRRAIAESYLYRAAKTAYEEHGVEGSTEHPEHGDTGDDSIWFGSSPVDYLRVTPVDELQDDDDAA